MNIYIGRIVVVVVVVALQSKQTGFMYTQFLKEISVQ